MRRCAHPHLGLGRSSRGTRSTPGSPGRFLHISESELEREKELSRARRNGDSYFWETSSERANRWHRAPQTLELPDTTEQPDSYE